MKKIVILFFLLSVSTTMFADIVVKYTTSDVKCIKKNKHCLKVRNGQTLSDKDRVILNMNDTLVLSDGILSYVWTSPGEFSVSEIAKSNRNGSETVLKGLVESVNTIVGRSANSGYVCIGVNAATVRGAHNELNKWLASKIYCFGKDMFSSHSSDNEFFNALEISKKDNRNGTTILSVKNICDETLFVNVIAFSKKHSAQLCYVFSLDGAPVCFCIPSGASFDFSQFPISLDRTIRYVAFGSKTPFNSIRINEYLQTGGLDIIHTYPEFNIYFSDSCK